MRCKPGMRTPVLLLAIAAVALGPAAAASAKEISAVKVCGVDGCHDVTDRATMAVTDGGPPTAWPDEASSFYRVKISVEGENGETVPGWSFRWVPAAEKVQFEDGTWGNPPSTTIDELNALTRSDRAAAGLQARAARAGRAGRDRRARARGARSRRRTADCRLGVHRRRRARARRAARARRRVRARPARRLRRRRVGSPSRNPGTPGCGRGHFAGSPPEPSKSRWDSLRIRASPGSVHDRPGRAGSSSTDSGVCGRVGVESGL